MEIDFLKNEKCGRGKKSPSSVPVMKCTDHDSIGRYLNHWKPHKH